MTLRILAFAGSARQDSHNKRLVRLAADKARAGGAEVTLLDLRDFPLPLYDGDLEASAGVPANARTLRGHFKAHQALLIASPEYNSGISPLLKNTIDWLSRELDGEPGTVPFRGKVATLLAASTGPFGGVRALPMVRQILTTLGVVVLPTQVAIGPAQDAFDEGGALRSPRHAAMLDAAVGELTRLGSRLG
jgi:NAD(P)H-dependent FMN reductase